MILRDFTSCDKEGHRKKAKDLICINKACNEKGFVCQFCLRNHNSHAKCVFPSGEIAEILLESDLKISSVSASCLDSSARMSWI